MCCTDHSVLQKIVSFLAELPIELDMLKILQKFFFAGKTGILYSLQASLMKLLGKSDCVFSFPFFYLFIFLCFLISSIHVHIERKSVINSDK